MLVVRRNTVALISCLFYSFCSITMVLGNKLLMTGEIGQVGKGAPFSLLMFQSAIVAVVLLMGRALGLFSFESFDCAVAIRWLPLNVLFIGDFLEFSILDVQGMGELRPSAFLSSFEVYGPTVAEGNLLYSGLTDEDWELQETGDLTKETYKLVMTQ